MNVTKLYPPILESSIPAFTSLIRIPFAHNALVGVNDFKGFQVQIKEINGNIIYEGPLTWENGSALILEVPISCIKDKIENNVNWYKFQIAYIDINNNIGYYSSAAVGKYLGSTTKDNFKVTLTKEYFNGSEFITGAYIHDNDPSEKEYSYRFILKNSAQKILVDTGEVLHNINSSQDENTRSYDEFKCNYRLTTNQNYKLDYEVTTINGYKLFTSINLRGNYFDNGINVIPFTIEAILDRDRGSVNVIAKYIDNRSSDETERKQLSPSQQITGTFILRRVCSKDNYFKIFNIKTFCLLNTPLSDLSEGILLYKDFTVESGYSYEYYIQQISKNKKVYSQAKSAMYKNQNINVSFDDCFLYDGERQLNIKFNPKISSFKSNILGTKTETIGSKYPFISYNANVNYKEFPLSGLISYNMDEGEDFMKGMFAINKMRGTLLSEKNDKEPLTLVRPHPHNYINEFDYDYNVTDLTDRNILLEKQFKLSVLDFLNNKKPKLFRSPTEGNYVVVTMNNSLSPIDSLGRMLHNFSSTAYEIMDTDQFVEDIIEKTAINYLMSDEIWSREGEDNIFRSFSAQKKNTNYNLMKYNEFAKEVHIREAKPMSMITFGIVTLPDYSNIKYIPITIGATGSYNYKCFRDKDYIASIQLGDRAHKYNNKPDFCNFILYDCLNIVQNIFDNITEVESDMVFGKELQPNNINDEENQPISLINNFYTPPTSEEDGYVNVITKVHLLKIRNFNMFHSNLIKYYIGDLYDILQELNDLKLFIKEINGEEKYIIVCSSGLKPYIEDTDGFGQATNLDRTDLEELNFYERNNPNIKYYLTYKIEYLDSVENFENKINNIKYIINNSLEQQTKTITLLPQETKDIVLNYSINMEINNQDDFVAFSPTNLIIYPSSNDIHCNLFANFTKVYFFEGALIVGQEDNENAI